MFCILYVTQVSPGFKIYRIEFPIISKYKSMPHPTGLWEVWSSLQLLVMTFSVSRLWFSTFQPSTAATGFFFRPFSLFRHSFDT